MSTSKKRNKKVASIVLNNFVNDSRVLKEVKSLVSDGYDVTVAALLTGDVPEYEAHDGYDVKRIHLTSRALPKGKFFGAIKYCELIFKIIWNFRKYEIWHCNDFEPLLMAAILKMFKRRLKVVYDAHEYAREKNGRDGINKWFVNKVEPWAIKAADEVITVSEGIVEEYKRLYGLEKVHLVYNAPHKREKVEGKKDLFRAKFNIPQDEKIFLYQGKFIKGRGISLVLEAFERLTDAKVHLVFLGNGVLLDEILPMVEKHSHIHYHEAVPYEKIIDYSSSADFGLVSVENVCLSYYYCMPNKMFEYIQARIPIITTNLYDCKNLIEKENIGLVIPEFTPSSFAETILLARETDVSGYSAGLEKAANEYHWDVEEKKFLELYNHL